jgi:hypothetical protein
MSDRAATPQELRMEAHSVLDRLRRLGRSAHDGGRLTPEEIDAITASLAAFQVRIEETARHYNHCWALQDVLAARRHIDEARLIVLGLLADLDTA